MSSVIGATVDAEDAKLNNEAVNIGERLLSSYSTSQGTKVPEALRSGIIDKTFSRRCGASMAGRT